MDFAASRRSSVIDALFISVFNSILDIEEASLRNRLTGDLTIHEIHTITAIGYRRRDPMKDVAARLDVTLATLNAAINRLVAKGFVYRQRDVSDKRRVLIGLTKRGRQVYRVHELFHRAMISEAMEDLCEDEQRVLETSLVKLQDFFERRKGAVRSVSEA